MANLIYTQGMKRLASAGDWTAGVFRAMLERSTSTYSPNKDHDFVSDLTGFVEISVASYARVTLGGNAANANDTSDRLELDCNDLAFGSLEAGQTVKSIIIYEQTGGNDSSPSDDTLICRIDTDSGGLLPVALGGGAFNVTINAAGLLQQSQP